MTLNYNYTI